jgi:N-acetylmuramoyl-L-alanine amidase CwlA
MEAQSLEHVHHAVNRFLRVQHLPLNNCAAGSNQQETACLQVVQRGGSDSRQENESTICELCSF